MTGFETSPAWMASVRAASFGHASAPAPCAEPSSGPEIPSHAQPRVCVRKATQENGTVRCTHAASARPRTGSVSHVIHGGRVLTLAHACAFAQAKRPAGSQEGASDKAADPATTDERTAHAPDGAADHAPADDSAGRPGPAAIPHSMSVPSSPAMAGSPLGSGQPRVPFGYVPGAISVELPKRQRSLKQGSAAFPRSFSSLV